MSDELLWYIYGGRCVVCKRKAVDINHIVPRSADHALIDDWRNKVPLCKTCHDEYHDGGVTEEKMKTMKKMQHDFLIARGKENYAQETQD